MKTPSVKIILISILCLESLLTFYTFNYTTRLKNPTFIYINNHKIKFIDISSTGEDVVIYDESFSISFISKNKLSWFYNSKTEIIDIKISKLGDYFTTLDSNGTVSLFSKVLNIEKIAPIWSYHLPFCKISDIYSAGSIPPLIYVLVSRGKSLLLIASGGISKWSYELVSEESISKISFDGSWIVSIDSEGVVYAFSIDEPEPSWILKTDIIKASLDISLDNRYIVVGGEDKYSGKGLIYLLLLKNGEIKTKMEFESPIKKVYVSSDGSKIFAYFEDGNVMVFYRENGNIKYKKIIFDQKIKSVLIPPYGSYILVINYDGDIYFYHLSRIAPLWKFVAKSEDPIVSISWNGEKIFIAESNNINYLFNSPLTELIPGSRSLWAIIFSIGIATLIALSFIFLKKHKIILGNKNEVLIAIIGFSIGTLLGTFTFKSIIEQAIYCGSPFAAGCLFSSKKKNITSFLIGCYIGFIVSGIIGFILGLSKWSFGDERDIIQLTIYHTINSLNIGTLYGILGAVTGILIASYHKNR